MFSDAYVSILVSIFYINFSYGFLISVLIKIYGRLLRLWWPLMSAFGDLILREREPLEEI